MTQTEILAIMYLHTERAFGPDGQGYVVMNESEFGEVANEIEAVGIIRSDSKYRAEHERRLRLNLPIQSREVIPPTPTQLQKARTEIAGLNGVGGVPGC